MDFYQWKGLGPATLTVEKIFGTGIAVLLMTNSIDWRLRVYPIAP